MEITLWPFQNSELEDSKQKCITMEKQLSRIRCAQMSVAAIDHDHESDGDANSRSNVENIADDLELTLTCLVEEIKSKHGAIVSAETRLSTARLQWP